MKTLVVLKSLVTGVLEQFCSWLLLEPSKEGVTEGCGLAQLMWGSGGLALQTHAQLPGREASAAF